MAGEEGSRITRSMAANKRAAKEAVAAGEDHHGLMEKRTPRSCTTKRKTEESVSSTAVIGWSELKQGAAAKGDEEEEAPAKKKGRLPQEEVDRILARVQNDDRLPRAIVDPKRRNPDLIPSPEEEMDEETMDLYAEARLTYHVRERFPKFQAWVRSEYGNKGYVEVEEDILVRLEDTKAWEEELKADLAVRHIKPHA